VWESQLGAKRIRADANLAAMFGLPAEPTVLDDETWMGRIHPEDRARFENDLAQRRLDRQPLDCEFRVLHPDGTVRWLAVQGAVVRQSDEQRGRSVGVARDVTERRLAEERQRLLLHELNHRVRNSLATVLALAQQTAATAETVPGFLDAYRARVMALAQAHNLLTQGNWEGTSLRALVEAILAPDAHANPGAVEVRGPEVDLAAPQALAIVLGLHELATNARKYGALSAPRGRVAVEWRCTQDDGGVLVSLQWAEAGGPPVSVPTRRGFGSRMLTRSLATDLDGTVTLDFEPSGVQCRIAFRSERRHG
jgi:PAS domain S-box-containing protein